MSVYQGWRGDYINRLHSGDTDTETQALRGLILLDALDRAWDLVADWQANGNSRKLGDPTAATWHEAARQLLSVLDGKKD